MNIYMLTCRLYWQGMSAEEIANTFSKELTEYEHQTHEHCIRFTNPIDAVNAIVESEKKAHKQAREFEC